MEACVIYIKQIPTDLFIISGRLKALVESIRNLEILSNSTKTSNLPSNGVSVGDI